MTVESSKTEIRRVAGRIGAEIRGIDLGDPEKLLPETMAEIRAALLRHKVVFFSGQHLDHAAQVAFARRLGEITRLPGAQHGTHPEGFPEILVVDPDVNDARHGTRFEERLHRKSERADSGWHVDVASVVNPPAISVLRCEVATEFGGDTQWTNLVAAYDGLSRPLQQLADGLRAEHALHAGVRLLFSDEEDLEIIRKRARETLVSLHPVVRVHPETGEKALFVPPASVSHIAGLLPWESDGILDILLAHLSRPEYTVRHQWTPGDIAVWDNRAVAHLQPADLHHTDYRRRMYRVLVLGDRPAGPDGFVSEAVRGEPLAPFHDPEEN
ncbi:TauD/TfdA dioxygenase family protein [Streptomyces luteolus]|uniref:TauD/TfdA family dioxygenase n=1 Tax=Streptomyces luteolus TaxID=3043615 RepID=A0ABT6T7P1_9ACTN|nr:TauD/TfdA family dioxygenase [Streptomyces sp. B-S-A12]MDI3423353.1 TauD/TfdA family dioxygenase [Streptomyces sp. B-S-A12]